jgi:hypothetical protein
MVRELLRFLAVVCVVGALVLNGYALFALWFMRALTSADPYPPLMVDLPRYRHSQTYEDLKAAFSRFVKDRFPTGSNQKQAIELMTAQGFRLVPSEQPDVTLLWERHAGPCGEQYYVTLRANENGQISAIDGRLHPICL